MARPMKDAIERVEHYRSNPPGSDAYRDSGDAQTDAELLADAFGELTRALWHVRTYQVGDSQRQQDVARSLFERHPDWIPDGDA
jgi:hypothetical protein